MIAGRRIAEEPVARPVAAERRGAARWARVCLEVVMPPPPSGRTNLR